jgi:hypothetical protein
MRHDVCKVLLMINVCEGHVGKKKKTTTPNAASPVAVDEVKLVIVYLC